MAGGEMLSKDYEKLNGIRRHIKRMQAGTPLLLRATQAGGKEEMKICIFRVSEDLTHLCWSEQLDGDGMAHEVKLSSIIDVKEEPGLEDEEDHGSIVLTLQAEEGARKGPGQTSTMQLSCASAEDLVTWRDGLRSLIGAGKTLTDVPPSPASSTASAKRLRTAAPPTAALSQASASRQEAQASPAVRDKLRQQEDEIAKLRQENGMLHEMVKRKDVTIAQLMRDLQNRPTSSDLCNKTESTSRESDNHLHQRETVILKRKNQRLKSANDAKQQTITQLMGVIQSCLEKQNEAIELEDSEDLFDVADTSRQRGAQQPSSASLGDDDDDSEPEAIREEMRTLAGKLEQLERDVEELQPQAAFGAGYSMPANGALASAAAASSVSAATTATPALSATAPVPSALAAALSSTAMALNGDNGSRANFRPPPRGPPAEQGKQASQAAAFDFSAVGGAPPSLGGNSARCSPAALEALAKEMELLEEKKRVVEQLARKLEPASDGEEEDDGFPLR
mmetsp:Transcript_103501/g.179734  ORF Transcript_103501/g.179734 Transcript_103501/m.179734 type:complete len:507 (-) Transcript_103501:9-1529(-)